MRCQVEVMEVCGASGSSRERAQKFALDPKNILLPTVATLWSMALVGCAAHSIAVGLRRVAEQSSVDFRTIPLHCAVCTEEIAVNAATPRSCRS